MYYLIILTIVAIDQIAKYGISDDPIGKVTADIAFFDIRYIQNKGVAFGMFEGHMWIFIVITSVIILIGMAYLWKKRKEKSRMFLLGISFMIAGGIGNLIDRSIRGYVIDYIDIGPWPVFNIADMFVVAGGLLIAAYLIYFEEKAKRVKTIS